MSRTSGFHRLLRPHGPTSSRTDRHHKGPATPVVLSSDIIIDDDHLIVRIRPNLDTFDSLTNTIRLFVTEYDDMTGFSEEPCIMAAHFLHATILSSLSAARHRRPRSTADSQLRWSEWPPTP